MNIYSYNQEELKVASCCTVGIIAHKLEKRILTEIKLTFSKL